MVQYIHTKYNIQGIIYKVQYVRYNIQGTIYMVQYIHTKYNIQGIIYKVQYTSYNIQGTICKVQYTRYYIQGTIYKDTRYNIILVKGTGYLVRYVLPERANIWTVATYILSLVQYEKF